MRNTALVAVLVVAAAGSVSAQASIDPGMSRDQVVAKLGKPISEHSSGTSTYLYYSNGQEKKMGMSDLVALENGKVVNAVFRSSARKYTGRSSSPAPISAEAAIAKGNDGKAPMKKVAAPTKVAVPAKPAPAMMKAPGSAKKAIPAPTKKP